MSWQNYKINSSTNFKPECLCVDCAKWRQTKIDALKAQVENKDFDKLAELSEIIKEEKVPLNVETQQWLDYQNHKLKIQKQIAQKLEKLKYVEDYKKIKKAVFELEEMIPEDIILDQDVVERVTEELKRLNSERNLRFFLDEYCGKLDSAFEDPVERVKRIKLEKEKKALMGKNKKRKRKVKSKKKEKFRKDKKSKEKQNEQPKQMDPEEILKNIKFDITIEDIEKQENEPDPVDISELQPLISQLDMYLTCLLYTSPSPRDLSTSRMPSSA